MGRPCARVFRNRGANGCPIKRPIKALLGCEWLTRDDYIAMCGDAPRFAVLPKPAGHSGLTALSNPPVLKPSVNFFQTPAVRKDIGRAVAQPQFPEKNRQWRSLSTELFHGAGRLPNTGACLPLPRSSSVFASLAARTDRLASTPRLPRLERKLFPLIPSMLLLSQKSSIVFERPIPR